MLPTTGYYVLGWWSIIEALLGCIVQFSAHIWNQVLESDNLHLQQQKLEAQFPKEVS